MAWADDASHNTGQQERFGEYPWKPRQGKVMSEAQKTRNKYLRWAITE